jgi:hypothetical protein
MVTQSPECAARASREVHVLDGRVVDLERPRVTVTREDETTSGLASTLN